MLKSVDVLVSLLEILYSKFDRFFPPNVDAYLRTYVMIGSCGSWTTFMSIIDEVSFWIITLGVSPQILLS